MFQQYLQSNHPKFHIKLLASLTFSFFYEDAYDLVFERDILRCRILGFGIEHVQKRTLISHIGAHDCHEKMLYINDRAITWLVLHAIASMIPGCPSGERKTYFQLCGGLF